MTRSMLFRTATRTASWSATATMIVVFGRADLDGDDGAGSFRAGTPRPRSRLRDGCPPGLDKKDNGCMPPGLHKKLVGTPLTAALGLRALGGPYRNWYRDNDHYCIVGTTIIFIASAATAADRRALPLSEPRLLLLSGRDGLSVRTTTTTCPSSISPSIRTAAIIGTAMATERSIRSIHRPG